MPAIYIYILTLLTSSISLVAQTHHVGAAQTYVSLTQAVAVTKPGDTILVHEGNYAGGLHFAGLQGTAENKSILLPRPCQW
jgi:hypothetical protein